MFVVLFLSAKGIFLSVHRSYFHILSTTHKWDFRKLYLTESFSVIEWDLFRRHIKILNCVVGWSGVAKLCILRHWGVQLILAYIPVPPSSLSISFNHYENKPIQIYWKFYHQKNESFQMKNSKICHISAQNIDCGYSLEPPRRGGSNEYPQSMFWAEIRKMMHTPGNPSFTIYAYPCKPQFY